MLLVDRQTVPAALRERSAAQLKLRVRKGGQILELAEGKTTIGSSPRCNLRLDGAGVEPMHCLVVDGPEGLRVRRWAADTRLNGERVEDAPLEAGDCLSLGGVELELVGPAATAKVPEMMGRHVAEELANAEESEESEDEARVEIPSVVEEILVEEKPVEKVSEAVDDDRATEDWLPYYEAATTGDEVDAAGEEKDTLDDEFGGVPDASEATCRWDADEFGDYDAEPDETISAPAIIETSDGERALGELLPENDAVELVFRELQMACVVARGRNRKMLAALRSLRAEKQALVRRLEDGERTSDLGAVRAHWEAAREDAGQDEQGLLLELKELRRELGEWEVRLAEHTRQMVELQQELEAARAAGATVAGNQVAANEDIAIEPSALLMVEPLETQSARENTSTQCEAWELSPVEVTECPPVVDVSSGTIDEIRAEELGVSLLSDVSAAEESHSEADADTATVEPWDLPSERNVDSTVLDVPSDRSEIAGSEEPWSDTDSTEDSLDESHFGDDINSEAMPSERPAWESDAPAGVEVGGDDLSPFAEFSIWKQGASSEQTSFDDASASHAEAPQASESSTWGSGSFGDAADSDDSPFRKPEENLASDDTINPWAVAAEKASADAEVTGAAFEIEAAVAPVQPTSFIDRYSHLFANEAEPAPAEKAETSIAQPPQAVPLPAAVMNPATPAAASSTDDESIEQYMAKLMKRVRGEGPVVAASQGTPIAAPAKEELPVATSASTTAEQDPQQEASANVDAAKPEEEHPEVPVNWDAFTRRAATASATDMGALRALANETARRDISIHQLRRHRRDAKTKVIVSMLAGMTSLWLMLNSPNWRDMQFITACVTLIVAAYWAGEALRETFKSRRSAYGSPRVNHAEDSPLPIDVR